MLEKIGNVLFALFVGGIALSFFLNPLVDFAMGPPAPSELSATEGIIEQADPYCSTRGSYASVSIKTVAGLEKLSVGCTQQWAEVFPRSIGKYISIKTRRTPMSYIRSSPLEVWHLQIDQKKFISYAEEVEKSRNKAPYFALLSLVGSLAFAHMTLIGVKQLWSRYK